MDNLNQPNQGNLEQTPSGAIHHNLADITPTSTELGNLWRSYYAESMSVAFLKHFVQHAKEPDIKPILQRALDISTQRLDAMEQLFISVKHPIPEAFGENDVDVSAKALFSESFNLVYTRLMHKYVLNNYVKGLTCSYRPDFSNFFSECIKTSDEIYRKSTEVLLGKGILGKAPIITIPDTVDYVHNKNYFGNFFGNLFADQRPLNVLEVGEIYSIIEIQQLLKVLTLGYRQVIKSKDISDYFSKVLERIDDDMENFASVLSKENIPIPMTTDTLVTESKESAFSDKLILSHLTSTIAFSLTALGLAMPNIVRKDLVVMLQTVTAKVLMASKEGAELMIGAGWFERIPQTVDREELLH